MTHHIEIVTRAKDLSPVDAAAILVDRCNDPSTHGGHYTMTAFVRALANKDSGALDMLIDELREYVGKPSDEVGTF